MKILSWDVGIIHLAYCILSLDNDKWTIYNWGLLDMSNKDAIKCRYCDKTAKVGNNLEEKEYYCGVHSKKYVAKELKDEEFIIIGENKLACSYNNCSKKGNNVCVSDNKTYCKTHIKILYKRYCEDIKLKSLKKIKANQISIDHVRFELIKRLDTMPELLQVDGVLIENQPSLKNPKMKSIASTLSDFFMIRGLIDRKNNSTINFVKFMSPSNKIKLGNNNKIVKEAAEDKKYKLTKSLAVSYCKECLKGQNNWLAFLDTNKKKDDLADCFLQGAYYLSVMLKDS